MITYLQVSLFQSPAQTLVNTVNTVGVMGKGIAASFKELYPEMFKEYRRLCLNGQFDIGKLYIYRTPNKLIVNFPTKRHWRNPSKIEYIQVGLEKFISRYHDYGISSVSFPQLGCGHGELDWDDQVHPIMERYLKDLPIPVYIHLYQQSPGFVPERLDGFYASQVHVERQRISNEQLWQDLRNLTGGNDTNERQFSLFGPTIFVNDEYIRFKPLSGEPVFVYREDVEDLWNILRVRGTLQETDILESIRQDGASEWLLDLFSQLAYVQSINLRVRDSKTFLRGLQYDPQPQKESKNQIDIIV